MDIKARALTYGQLKTLRKAGYDLTRINKDTVKGNYDGLVQDALEYIVELVYPELKDKLDDMPYKDIIQLGNETLVATYGSGESAKN